MFKGLTITFLIITMLLPWQGCIAQWCGNDESMACCAASAPSVNCRPSDETDWDKDRLFTTSIDLCDYAELCDCEDGRSRVTSSLPAGERWSGHDSVPVRHLTLKQSVTPTLRQLSTSLPKPLDRSGTYIQHHSFRI